MGHIHIVNMINNCDFDPFNAWTTASLTVITVTRIISAAAAATYWLLLDYCRSLPQCYPAMLPVLPGSNSRSRN